MEFDYAKLVNIVTNIAIWLESIFIFILQSKCRIQNLLNYLFVDLEQLLQKEYNARLRLIATDGVFSMDGNVTPLDEICALSEKYNAIVFVDDCHATGFFGQNGRYIIFIIYLY